MFSLSGRVVPGRGCSAAVYMNEPERICQGRRKWSVLVIFEDSAARESAIAFCARLAQRFWDNHRFEIAWCSGPEPGHADEIGGTADQAVAADMLVFALSTGKPLSREWLHWIRGWRHRRGDREGLLFRLAPEDLPPDSLRDLYLRHLAHRLGMDFLTEFPLQLGPTVPDSLDSYAERADQVTSLLDGILHYSPASPRSFETESAP